MAVINACVDDIGVTPEVFIEGVLTVLVVAKDPDIVRDGGGTGESLLPKVSANLVLATASVDVVEAIILEAGVQLVVA